MYYEKEKTEIKSTDITDNAVHSEVGELLKLNAYLRDREEMYRKLTQYNRDAIIILNSEGNIVSWNQAAEEMFGYSYSEVVGRDLHSLLAPPEYRERAKKNIAKFKETGTGRFVDKVTELNTMRKDGTTFIAEISISTVNVGTSIHSIGIIRDVSDRRLTHRKLMDAMDAAETANMAKSRFIANISHEIRTPMNGIIGFLDLLSKTPLNIQQKDYVKAIRTASDSLLHLMNDLLDFSKLEVKKMELESVNFSISTIIEVATLMFAMRAYSKGIELYAKIDPAITVDVTGDPGKLKQILINLISNAVKFTKTGAVHVEAHAIMQTDDSITVHFAVTDTGIGISQDHINKLFEPFTQVDASTTRRYGGTGLGLSICDKLVKMMDGKLKVISEQGKGSKFSFDLSFHKGSFEIEEADFCASVLQGIHVLIADQRSMNREIVRYYLEDVGCLVSEMAHTENVIELLKSSSLSGHPIRLVVLGDMQGLSGLELAKMIKKEESLEDIIICLFSPYANPCDREIAYAEGISELILTPVYRTELLSRVLTSLGLADTKYELIDDQPDDNVIFDPNMFLNARLLIVDDNVTIRKLVSIILENTGITFDVEVNGKDALEAIKKINYDIVFMDCQMPIMDGYEATKRIRESESEGKHRIIIAMTANVMPNDIKRCMDCGMDDYIGKPFKSNDLLRMIYKWLKPNNNWAMDDNLAIRVSQEETFLTKETRSEIPTLLEKFSIEQQIDKLDLFEIYNEFVDYLPGYIERITKAIEKGDIDMLLVDAHTLKGSAATLRLSYLSNLAAAIHEQGKAKNLFMCSQNMDKLMKYCSEHIQKISI